MEKLKNLWNIESPESTWEIVHREESNTVDLDFYKPDSSGPDKTITLTYSEFDDLMHFMVLISKGHYQKDILKNDA